MIFLLPVVEDDEDGFPNTRPDGDGFHNNDSKEKRELDEAGIMGTC